MPILLCRFGCKSTKTQHGEHCDEPDEIEARVSVLIACATIEYLIAMGTFVLYLNFGGLAVKGLMEDVRRNLRRLPDAHRACVVAKGTHMYRIHYCVGDPREQADSVTRHMMNMSDQIDSFMRNVVNPIRVNERKRRFKWQDGAMMNKLYDDDNAVCVVSDFHQASVDNLYAKSHQQAVARGHMAAEALRKKYGDNCYQMLGRLSMETQAARYGQTVSERAADLGRLSMETQAARYGQTVSERATDLGRLSMATQAARYGQTVSERAADLSNYSMLVQGLKLQNIDVDSLLKYLNEGETLEERALASGIDVKKTKSKWMSEMRKKVKNKSAGIDGLVKKLTTRGQTINDHMAAMRSNFTSEGSKRGAQIAIKKALLENVVSFHM